MQLNVVDAKPIELDDAVFSAPFREGLVHQVVVAYQAGARAGTKAQKTRAEVRLTGKKSIRQKGSGGARHGARSAPIFVGGGVTFAAKPRSFEQKVNRKMYRAALRSILAELIRQDRLKLVDAIGVSEPRTKALVSRLAALGTTGRRVLIVDEDASDALFLAARNLPNVYVVDVAAINPASLVGADNVVMTVATAKKIQEWLA